MKSLKLLFSATMIVAMLFACNGTSQTKDSYETAKETLAEKEAKSPVKFLAVVGKDRKNIIGQTILKGTVTNNATVCKYKDVEIEISFFSKTNALLEKDVEVVYDVLEPGKSTSFKTKYFAPKGTDNVQMKVVRAKVE